MSSSNIPTVVVNPEINLDVDEIIAKSQAAAAAMDAAYKELADRMQAVIDRIYTTLDQVSEAAGAWHCMNCGEWTIEMVTIESHSDEMGTETTEGCPRCAEVR